MPVTIYHNPLCSKSRKALTIIEEAGYLPEVIEYLKTALSQKTLETLASQIPGGARSMLRDSFEMYHSLNLDDDQWTDDELIGFMAEFPQLINRPIVATEKGVRLCRPPEVVLDILP